MNQESCCCCARLLKHIGSCEVGSEPPSYSASAISSDRVSFDEKRGGYGILRNQGQEIGSLYDGEKYGEESEMNDPRSEPEYMKGGEESGAWKEGRGNGRSRDRRLPCCDRIICGECIEGNERFSSYCPFCQVSSGDAIDGDTATNAARPKSNSKDEPPSYEDTIHSPSSNSQSHPPAYPTAQSSKSQSKSQPQIEDTLHFLDHKTDSMTSLSLRYGVPVEVLRKKNGITSDYLLLARKTILIPGEWYKGGLSLSPRPVEGEEEERRKGFVRRFMVGCKVAE